MVNGIVPEEFAQMEKDDYETFGRPPKGFDPCDPERIQIFAKRLRGIREKRRAESRAEDESGGTFWLAKDLAAELHISPMAVCKYEHGNMKSIPMHRLRRICGFYNVSPHYLLGYVEGENDYLQLDKNGEPLRDQNGDRKILHAPMLFAPASFVEASEAYQNLYLEDTELFWILYEIIVSKKEKRDRYRTVLSGLLGLNE